MINLTKEQHELLNAAISPALERFEKLEEKLRKPTNGLVDRLRHLAHRAECDAGKLFYLAMFVHILDGLCDLDGREATEAGDPVTATVESYRDYWRNQQNWWNPKLTTSPVANYRDLCEFQARKDVLTVLDDLVRMEVKP